MSAMVFRELGSPSALTAQERRILAMIAAGDSLVRIASRAELSDHTVKYHLKKIFLKLGASGRAHAVAIAIAHGLLPPAAPVAQQRSKTPSLTPAQQRVLGLMASGCSVKQIADRVGISRYTVKYHLKYAFWKLGAQGRAHAVAVAARHGLLPNKAALSSPLSIRWISNTTALENGGVSGRAMLDRRHGAMASDATGADAGLGLSYALDAPDAPASARW